jgi:diguanylate cyclase (GGDEF)-like protein
LLLTLLPPFLLFLLLGMWRLTAFALVNGVMLYLFSIALTIAIMLTIRYFYQRAFVLEQRLLHLTRHDSLTGAANRRYLEEMTEREIALARRHQHPLAVAMLDIDHFKLVNDRYGHDVGDQVLQILVQTCQQALREIDHFGRYGGEEFVCILPETDQDEAQRCAERLRAAVAGLKVDTATGPLTFTISIGVAMFSPLHADFAAVLKEADGAMYQAKSKGRDRVVLAAGALADAARPLSTI